MTTSSPPNPDHPAVYVRSASRKALNKWLRAGGDVTGCYVDPGTGERTPRGLDGSLPGGTEIILTDGGLIVSSGKWRAVRREVV